VSPILTALLAGARERFPEGVSEPVEAYGETSIEVGRKAWREVIAYLRDEGPFEYLSDISCVDFLGIEPDERRFLIAVHLASITQTDRLRVRGFTGEQDPTWPSLCSVYAGADFQEREIYDFFGITFDGHPNMRRILMPDDWEGHPQRKDYALGGITIPYHNGAFIPAPEVRGQGEATTTGYPGRIS
jgi:NADH-quinone oxidoreductase subunit C